MVILYYFCFWCATVLKSSCPATPTTVTPLITTPENFKLTFKVGYSGFTEVLNSLIAQDVSLLYIYPKFTSGFLICVPHFSRIGVHCASF